MVNNFKHMKHALISTIDVEQPYRFCETAEVKFAVTEPALFWVECGDDVTPMTHKYTDKGFVELPPVAVESLSGK